MTAVHTTGLEVDGISCRRQDRLLFENLSFSLSPGEILEVRGPNGSGKTSLLRMLCGLRHPDEGQILWQGQSIDEEPTVFARHLCYLGHRTGLNADLTPLENLRLEAAIYGLDSELIPAVLERMGLSQALGLHCDALSAGQRQRVALARLVLREAQLWVLDEPYASLDKTAQNQVQAMMARHCEGGGAIVFTTHQPMPFDGINLQHLTLGVDA